MRRVFAVIGVLMALAAGVLAQQRQAEIDLQAAIRAETVDGDLQRAIAMYDELTTKHKGNRAVVATALVRMAQAYEKLGRNQARAVYERILRDYTDQPDAVRTARARLTLDNPSVAKGDRAVWTGPKVDMFGQVSPDGRFITYVDWGGDQNLIVHDMLTNTDRPLTATGPSIGFSQFAEFSTISRDGKQVAYAWYNDKSRYDLRIVPLHGTSVARARVLFPGSDEIRGIAPRDWSPDGKWIAVTLRRDDGTKQIGLVAIADGSLRVLKSVDWRGAETMRFSPDGRLLAYDLPVGESNSECHIYLLAVDGSSESAVVAHPSKNKFMAWSPDGRYLLFATDRAGSPALWAQAVELGKARGTPRLIRSDIGDSWPLGLTDAGTLYVFKPGFANYVHVSGIDLPERKVLPLQASDFQRFVGSGGGPTWSRDGKFLAYKVCGTASASSCGVAIVSQDTGQVREIYPKLSYLGSKRWAADGKSFLIDGTDFKGRRALYRADAQTGEIAFVHERPGAIVQWAPDDSKIYYRRGGSIVERELASGAERELFGERAVGNSVSIKVSPDGRTIAAVETAGVVDTLYLIPVSGGAPVELLRTKAGERFNGFLLQWTPDNRAVLLPKAVGSLEGPRTFWVVPADGSAPRELDFKSQDVGSGGGFAIHPNGRQVAFTAQASKRGHEVWALENFLPALQ